MGMSFFCACAVCSIMANTIPSINDLNQIDLFAFIQKYLTA
jgi:hypothetical protein